MRIIKTVVFDIGGTLMEYKNMPNVWIDFYTSAFNHVNHVLKLNLNAEDILQSVEKLKYYNPRVRYREVDYAPDMIFKDVTAHWNCSFLLDDVIDVFFSSLKLQPYIYPETIEVLNALKSKGYHIATLTDVATGMPDELHKSYFQQLMPYFDMYVSSSSCGYRKPNPKGLIDIAEKFNIDADNMIFVGDEEKDIAVAKRFGCCCALIDRHNTGTDFGQDFTICNLHELADKILNV